MNLIQITYGDLSRDGHQLFRSFIVKSDLSFEAVNSAYNSIKDYLGFNFYSFAEEAEDNSIPAEYLEKIQEFCGQHFISKLEISIEHCTEEGIQSYSLSKDIFEALLIAVINRIDPYLELEKVEIPSLDLSIGYGLF